MTKKQTTLARRDGGISTFIEQMTPRLAEVATEHMSPERMLKIFAAAANAVPKLRDCTIESLASSLLLASQLGLEPGGPLGHLYLVPYGSECTPIVGYKGMLELIRRTGEIKRINANVFYQPEIDGGTIRIAHEPPGIEHEWTGEEYTDEQLAGSYCVVETMDGAAYTAICSRAEVEKRMSRSAARGSGPWKSDKPAMWRKSAVRKLFGGGTVPISAEKMALISRAMEADGDSATTRPTRAQRNMQIFRAPPAAIDTTAEPALPPADESDPHYDEARRLARQLDATDEEWASACVETFPGGVPRPMSDADVTALIGTIEQMKGV